MRTSVTPYGFGAKGDGRTKDTQAVQRAIDAACAEGARCLLAGGCFVCGTLYLKSGLTLEIAAGAVLLASPDAADYAEGTHHNRYRNERELDRCFLFAQDARHITLCGAGAVDGNAGAFGRRDAFHNGAGMPRPMLLRMLRCEDVRLEGLRLLNAASWTTAFLECDDVRAVDLTIRNTLNYNGDGLDFDGCRRVWVRGCAIDGTDDNLCLQSGARATRDVHISDCTFTSVCAGVRIGLKSIGEISGVVLSNCTMRDIRREGIKLECSEGGSITDVLVQNVAMHNVRRPIFALLNNRFEPDGLGSSVELTAMPPIGRMERLRFAGLSIADDSAMAGTQRRFGRDGMGSPRFGGIRFDANSEHPIRDVTLTDIRYTAIGGVAQSELPPDYPPVVDRLRAPHAPTSENYWPDWSRAACADLRHVQGLTLCRVVFDTLLPDERPLLLTEGCTVIKNRE